MNESDMRKPVCDIGGENEEKEATAFTQDIRKELCNVCGKILKKRGKAH